MLPRKNRVSTELFKEIVKKGKIFHLPFFTVYSMASHKISRFGISFSKNSIKTAVSRNEIKRRIYSIIRYLIPNMENNQNIVLIMKKRAKEVTFEELKKEISEIFVKIGILK